MSIRIGTASDTRLFSAFLAPSWLSGLIVIVVGVFILGGTITLTHLGGAVQQSLLGLGQAYQQTSIGGSVHAVGTKISSNPILNNSLLFILWGTVGLVVYSIAQSAVNEIRNTNELFHELDYVHANRNGMVRDIVLRGVIRAGALIAWAVLARYTIYTFIPYAIAATHNTALRLTSMHDWERSLLTTLGCMLSVHFLAVLLRLAMMRTRLFGSSLEE